jgi:hypothetical protein
MFVIAEVIHGKAYLLDECGRIWQVGVDHVGVPAMQLLDEVGREQIKRMAEPKLMNWLRD